MSKFQHLSIGMEAVDFQSDAFFKELALVFAPYVEKGAPARQDQDEMSKALSKIIERQCGMNSIVQFSRSGTCIFVPDIDGSNVLLGDYRGFANSEDGLKLIEKVGGRSSGQVDLKKGRLLGDFTKYIARINIDLGHFGSHGMSAEEIAAIVLHEVGHFFTYCEMLDRTVCANLILVGLDRELRGGDVKRREIAIERAGKAVGFERTVIEDLKKSNNDQSVTTVFITEMTGDVTSQSAHGFYDLNSWEMAADQFAARHGAGRALVTALDKLFVHYGKPVKQGKIAYYLFEVFKVIGLVFRLMWAVGSIISGTVLGVFGGVFLLAISFLFIRLAYTDGGDVPVYDKPLDRHMRVRRQLVEATKNPDLPKEMVARLADDIRIIDATTEGYTQRISWFEAVDNFLFKSSRLRRDTVKFQQDLERLAMNDLFVRSAELKHI